MPLPHPHHSFADWDFEEDCVYSPVHFIDPPHALANLPSNHCYARLIHPDTLNIPAGRLTLFWYIQATAEADAYFMLQPSPPFLPLTLGYHVHFRPGQPVSLWVTNPAPEVLLGTWPYNPPANAWFAPRITWTHACLPDATATFNVQLEIRAGPGMGDYGSLQDPIDPFSTSTTNGIGLWMGFFGRAWTDVLTLEQLT